MMRHFLRIILSGPVSRSGQIHLLTYTLRRYLIISRGRIGPSARRVEQVVRDASLYSTGCRIFDKSLFFCVFEIGYFACRDFIRSRTVRDYARSERLISLIIVGKTGRLFSIFDGATRVE